MIIYEIPHLQPMNVFTYFCPTPELPIENEVKLILLWQESWRRAGFNPKVLTEWHAQQHVGFENYERAISNLPSVNPPGYDRACYLRWLAVAIAMMPAGAGEFTIMTDYDVMNYGWEPTWSDYYDGLLHTHEGPGGCETERPGNCIPSVVVGDRDTFLRACEWFSTYQPRPSDLINGRPHTSDMYILESHVEKITRQNVCKVYSDTDWQKAPLVHYCNASMLPRGHSPRWQFIPQLRPS